MTATSTRRLAWTLGLLLLAPAVGAGTSPAPAAQRAPAAQPGQAGVAQSDAAQSAPAAPAVAQAVQPPPAAGAEPARELLERAARFQLAGSPSPSTSTLHGRFHVTVRGDDGNVSASVERWYTREPERILTHRVESVTGSEQTVGFDGQSAWFRDEGTGKVVVYSDEPENFEVDIEQIEEQMRLTRLLLDALVLDALLPRLSGLRLGESGTCTDLDGEVHAVRHAIARVRDELYAPPTDGPPPGPDDPPRWLELDFAIDTATGALWSLGVDPLGRTDVSPLELRFAFHEPTASGLRVPGNVRVFEEGAVDEAIRFGVEVTEEGTLALEIGAPIDTGRFAVPEQR